MSNQANFPSKKLYFCIKMKNNKVAVSSFRLFRTAALGVLFMENYVGCSFAAEDELGNFAGLYHQFGGRQVICEADTLDLSEKPHLKALLEQFRQWGRAEEEKAIRSSPLYQEIQKFKAEQAHFSGTTDDFLNYLADPRLPKPVACEINQYAVLGYLVARDMTATYPAIYAKLLDPDFSGLPAVTPVPAPKSAVKKAEPKLKRKAGEAEPKIKPEAVVSKKPVLVGGDVQPYEEEIDSFLSYYQGYLFEKGPHVSHLTETYRTLLRAICKNTYVSLRKPEYKTIFPLVCTYLFENENDDAYPTLYNSVYDRYQAVAGYLKVDEKIEDFFPGQDAEVLVVTKKRARGRALAVEGPAVDVAALPDVERFISAFAVGSRAGSGALGAVCRAIQSGSYRGDIVGPTGAYRNMNSLYKTYKEIVLKLKSFPGMYLEFSEKALAPDVCAYFEGLNPKRKKQQAVKPVIDPFVDVFNNDAPLVVGGLVGPEVEGEYGADAGGALEFSHEGESGFGIDSLSDAEDEDE